ncbi:MAG TPA: UDP binding domain-containing protein, partial [Anaerolineae bacterium]
PFVATLTTDLFALESIQLTEAALEQADCVVIVTDHDSYDWDWIAHQAPLIVDTRNAMKGRGDGRVVRL